MVPDVLHEDPDGVPRYVSPAVMHKACNSHLPPMLWFSPNAAIFQETRAAQALSRVDPDSLGEESFGWYTREAVGVVVALWTLLLGIIMCAFYPPFYVLVVELLTIFACTTPAIQPRRVRA
jgi:hypothetical protein